MEHIAYGNKHRQKFDVGVIGIGSVGRALYHVLSYYYKCAVYDIKGHHAWGDILDSNLVFVCVQTPLGRDGRLDCGHVTEVLERLSYSEYTKPIVVRSTVRVGFMDEMVTRFPSLRFVYSPEFLRERSAFQWTVCPDRVVLAGSPEDVEEARRIFCWIEDAEVIQTDYVSAELGKLAHNAYIATKVSFTNEIERIAKRYLADPLIVMGIVTADRRVKSREHLRPGLGAYDGKCVPKDHQELIGAAGEIGVLLKAVQKSNELTKMLAKQAPIVRTNPAGTLAKTWLSERDRRT